MSDIDEGDTPYEGLWCRQCGLKEQPGGRSACPECGAPRDLVVRFPYDGLPDNMHRSASDLAHEREQLAAQIAAAPARRRAELLAELFASVEREHTDGFEIYLDGATHRFVRRHHATPSSPFQSATGVGAIYLKGWNDADAALKKVT